MTYSHGHTPERVHRVTRGCRAGLFPQSMRGEIATTFTIIRGEFATITKYPYDANVVRNFRTTRCGYATKWRSIENTP